MKRIALFALPLAIALTAMVWPIARHGDAGVCALMTPARMLENPDLASELARALRSGDADEVARVRGKLQEIRAVHGTGWTVTASGPAEVITDPDEAAHYLRTLSGWTHGPHDTLLRLHPKTVTGFRLARAEA